MIPHQKAGVNRACRKNFFSARERFIIGVLAYAGVPYEVCNKIFPVSQSYYYELKVPACRILDKLFLSGEEVKGIILITQGFIERCLLALTFYCRSPIEGIVCFFNLVVGHHISKGKIHEIREQARAKAEEFDSQVVLSSIQYVAMDEIFQQETPILTVVDLETRYIPIMEPAENRTGETWNQVLTQQKEHGLQPRLNISDGGSGLLKGIPQAFPDIEMQMDVFHALRDLGSEVNKKERKAWAQLAELCELERRLTGQRVHKKTAEKYKIALTGIDDCLNRVDVLNILFSWLREHVGFSGYGYSTSLEICNWILDEMALLYPESKAYLSAINTFRKRLPSLLLFLKRMYAELDAVASIYRTDGHSFMLMYNQISYAADSVESDAIEKRLKHVFRDRLPDAKETFHIILGKTYRASSLIENVNGCLRAFIDLKREIPQKCFILLKVFFNTKRCMRSRKNEWKNTSAVERLTGNPYPEFLDIVTAPLNYVA